MASSGRACKGKFGTPYNWESRPFLPSSNVTKFHAFKNFDEWTKRGARTEDIGLKKGEARCSKKGVALETRTDADQNKQ